MKCPHCQIAFHADFIYTTIAARQGGAFTARNKADMQVHYQVGAVACPTCHRGVLHLKEIHGGAKIREHVIEPLSRGARALAAEIPEHLAEDFHEASIVLEDSAKASAALSRRCLQALLRDQGYKQKDLAPAIEAILAANVLPAELGESIDAIRAIGNFAAHPLKNTDTGSILPVEAHEAEWNLDVLEGLFDFFYVAPAKAKQRIAALNAKLEAAGKPQLKQPQDH